MAIVPSRVLPRADLSAREHVDDDDHPQGEQSTVANTPAPAASNDEGSKCT